ncbi:LysR family transcriptional regulator [Variovorax guangxiensis]|uniref:LysR family transcriptional regulator n=1 Tax=Variovorax guangxiensis TaxID=1775474 RepID=UPI00285A3F3C|nr:LysR family transcriptional regulator [Variovorax guangxiensis]MDR6858770.1 DNA-binding transcriptional LysR family regulator [Variovorax guangxiensis]
MANTLEGRGRADLTMIATLKALLDTGNVSRAADALGVTQPSVSQSLKRMRQYFGDELFVRSGNAMNPTPRAIELGPLVDRVMRDVNLISQPGSEFDPMAANREFIICMTDIGEYMIVPNLASVFASEAPGCSIRTRRIPQARLREALELGEADLAVGTLAGANRSLRQQRLGEYVVTCMVSTQGRWAKSALTGDDYAAARHVVVQRLSDSVDPITERLRAKGIHRSVALFVDNHFVAARAVAETDLICTVPNVVMGEQLVSTFPVKLVPLPFEFGHFVSRLLWHDRYHTDPSHVWLRNTVERSARKMVAWQRSP